MKPLVDLVDGKDEDKRRALADACKTILKCIGEDPDREGLRATPQRFAESMLTLTAGYHQNLVGTNMACMITYEN